MEPARLVIFDDGGGQWGPVTDLRATFDLRTGAVTTLQRIERALRKSTAALWVSRSPLHALVAAEHDQPLNPAKYDTPMLAVNGRWLGVVGTDTIAELPPDTALMQPDGQLVAAHLSAADAATLLPAAGPLGALPTNVRQTVAHEQMLIDRPWHVLDSLETTLRDDLAQVSLPQWTPGRQGTMSFGDHPVYVAEDAVVQPGAVFNTEQGPVVVDSKALIGALSVLEGPCYVGPGTTVVCHAHLRPHAVIGPRCKAAGEISFSIIDSCSNKAHHGYMGHCLVGRWVNLGAATNVSNLKNTYGSVRVQLEPDTDPQDTGRVFQGPIIGDGVRTAIGTRLLTGSCVGTGAMVAHGGYVPKYIPRLTFLTDRGACPYDIDKLVATLRTMMARRNCQLPQPLEARLRDLVS